MVVIKHKKITVLSDITSFLDKPHLFKAKINQFFIWNERRWYYLQSDYIVCQGQHEVLNNSPWTIKNNLFGSSN